MTALTARSTSEAATALAAGSADWRAAAMAMLSVRVIQGFIYWGGGSRRFIYDPSKLDPEAPSWMGNKLQTAIPGALFGLDRALAFLLQHFWLLYAAIILFSAVELIVGFALMAGLLTRLAALLSVGLSISLMLLFGWQGGTCIDEWTMASCNVAMGAALMLAGGAAYSLDNAWLGHNPALARRAWFRWCGGSLKLPLTEAGFRGLALWVLAFVLASTSASTVTIGVPSSRRITAARSAPRRIISRSPTQRCWPTAAFVSPSCSTAARPP